MIHEIQYPDWAAGGELRPIIWDDEAGTVEGEHSLVPLIPSFFEARLIAVKGGVTKLDDPAHTPEEFLLILAVNHRAGDDLDPRAVLPDSLKDITPRSLDTVALPDDVLG